MYIERSLEKKIRSYLHSPEIIAIVGPRQSGKTTLARRVYATLSDALFLTFEDIALRELFDLNLDVFVELYIKPYRYIFLDEFQYVKEGGQKLKFIYDTKPDKKIIITGSSSIDLTVKTLGFLAGRILVFHLYPLSYREFLRFKEPAIADFFSNQKWEDLPGTFPSAFLQKLQSNLMDFLLFGGFPRVVISETHAEKREILKNLYLTFVMRDIKDLLRVQEDYRFHKLIKAVSLQIGNMISYHELSQISEIHFPALKNYLNILEKTYIIKLISPFYKNKRTELVKAPKLYFIDTGLRNAIIDNFSLPDDRSDKGALYENFVFSELFKNEFSLHYWRTKSDAEVDFIFEKGPTLIAFEAKSRIKKGEISKSLHSFQQKYQPEKIFILNERLFEKRENFYFLPYFSLPFLDLESREP